MKINLKRTVCRTGNKGKSKSISRLTCSMLCKKWFLPTKCTTALQWGHKTLERLSWDLLNHSEKHPLLEIEEHI